MFEGLSDRLSGILSGLTRRGALTEADVTAAMREVRRALLEADVALEVVRGFTDRVKEKAVGAVVLKSVTPGQMVVKIVNDELVAMLGTDAETVDLNAPAPVPILMVGLQGSGKTTTTAKIARRLSDREKRKVLLASSTRAARPPWSSSRCWPSRSAWRACRSSPASPRCRSLSAPWTPPVSAGSTW